MVDVSLSSQLAGKETGDAYRQILPGVPRFLVVKYTYTKWSLVVHEETCDYGRERERERERERKKKQMVVEKSALNTMDHEKREQKRISVSLSKLRIILLGFTDSEESFCWTVERY